MDPVTRKALVMLLVIGSAEGVLLAFSLADAHPGVVARLATMPETFWPAWIVAACVAVAYISYSIRALPMIGRRFFEPHPLKLVAIPFALVTGTVEELWFRHQLMDWQRHLGAGLARQVLVSAAIFGLVHGVWGLFGKNLRVAIGSVLATGALGGALALVYLLAGRHVAPCVWSHIAINMAIEPWLVVAAISAGLKRNALP